MSTTLRCVPFVLCCAAALTPATAQNQARLMADLVPGIGSSSPKEFTEFLGATWFSAHDGTNRTLWRSDGTPAGSRVISPSVGAAFLTPARDQMFFVGRDAAGVAGEELWVTDGTTAGTHVIDVWPGTQSSSPKWLTPLGNRVIFRAQVGPVTHGTFVSDGTPGGTHQLGPHAEIYEAAGDRVFFVGFDRTHNKELWLTDGSVAGTMLVKDINPGLGSSNINQLAALGSNVVFPATDGTNGTEIWRSDGTPAGTIMLADVRPGVSSSNPRHLSPSGGWLLFFADDGQIGFEPYATDGTPGGTRLLKDVRPGAQFSLGTSTPIRFPAVNGRVVFWADDGATGREVWASDGSGAGTVLLRDIYPGPITSGATLLSKVGDHHVWFGANDNTGVRWVRCWKTDGTPAGTIEIARATNATNRNGPDEFGMINGKVVFLAGTANEGGEPWITDAGANVQTIGFGCGQNGRVPELSASNPVLGDVLTLDGDRCKPGSIALPMLSTPAADSIAVAGDCHLFVGPAGFSTLPAFPVAGGSWTLSGALPNDAALHEIAITIQILYLATGGPNAIELSNGIVLNLGR